MSDYITIFNTIDNTDVANNGIFAFIRNSLSTVPEYLSDVATLNTAYYYLHGDKIISPLVSKVMTGDTLTSDQSYTIAKVIIAACKTNWDKLYNALTIDYSPIENVDGYVTETTTTSGNSTNKETRADTGTDNHSYGGTVEAANTGTNTDAITGTDTTTNSGTDTTKNTGTSENKNVNENGTSQTVNKIFGYDSTDGADDGTSTTTVNQTVTDTRTDDLTATTEHGLTTTLEHGQTDTQTLDTKNVTTYNNSDDETLNLSHTLDGSGTHSGSEQHELHRHGNIGVTTNQQMITEEIELRKHYFIEMMFRDIDHYMTIPIY